MSKTLVFVFLFLTLATGALGETDYTGTYMSKGEFESVSVILKQDAQGQVQGTMIGEGMKLRIQGEVRPPATYGVARDAV